MNIPFLLKDDSKFKTFIAEAKQAKLVNLEGHRSVGGGRVSLYNGISVAET
jgi:phosphoserine aminotransferase